MNNYKTYFIILIMYVLSCLSCAANRKPVQAEIIAGEVVPGIEVLQHTGFEILQNKRVGLVTNPTGVNRQLSSTIDILFNSDQVNLVALFGPEHGVRGNFSAGDHIGNKVDEKTGLPVYSLYGSDRKPNSDALELVDVIVYDIQDIGVRSYTYISTMGLVMEAAAEQNKEVVILDRPNPLGGNRIEGPGVENGFYSFISQYNIPYVYGLTCGELALMLNGEKMLAENRQCSLHVVPMQGWRRDMTYDETGLHWVPPSPHIPDYTTSFYYAATGIVGEIDPNMIGIGYTLPFKTLVTESINAERLCEAMNNLGLEGVFFRPIYFKPYYQAKAGKELQGVQIHLSDLKKASLTEIQFLFLQVANDLDPEFNIFKGNEHRFRMFDLGCGTDTIRTSLMEDFNFQKINHLWNRDQESFRRLSEKYHLY
jgi:uncharacterized protein YbbC (DUF1343 family)